MQLETILNKLCCPFDKADLDLKPIVKDDDDHIIEGILTCTKCRRLYPIVSGIPIMTPDEFRDQSLEQPLFEKWEAFLDGKVENFKLLEEKPADDE